MSQDSCKPILITNRGDAPLSEYLGFIRICAESGITSIQLREKIASPEFLFEFGSKLIEVLAPFKIPLVIYVHVNLAVQLKEDGVHLDQTDGDPRQVRTILGKDKIIGWTIETEEQLEQAAHPTTTSGSFRTAFIDALYSPDLEKMRERFV